MTIKTPTARKSLKTALLAMASLATLLGLSAPAAAGDPPIGNQTLQIAPREQPVGQFLQSFFGQLGVPVIISPNLRGTVNGAFSGPASTIFSQVADAFDLVAYYDGRAVYIYQTSELTSQSIPASPQMLRRVRATAQEMGLLDSRNTLQPAGQMLIANGTRRFIQQIDEIARAGPGARAEAAQPTYEYRVFTLRYAWAEDVTFETAQSEVTIPGVASILRAMVSNDPNGAVARRIETRRSSRVGGLRGQGLASQGAAQNGLMDASYVDGGFTPTPDTLGLALADEQMAGGAPVQHARIQADTRLNAVIVRDTTDRMGAYEALIAALDKEPQLLEIQATIIDIDTTRARQLGISWRFDDGRGGVLFGDGTRNDDRLRRGQDITPRNNGLAISTIIGNGDYFVSRITAMEDEGVARIVSRPQIVTLSNVQALFENTRSFYVGLEGERDVDLYNVTAGTTLKVTPHVLRDQNQTRIRMQIQIEDGSLTDADVDDIPVVQRAALNTQAMILEGQSLLLGGMVVQQDVNAVTKVPVLGDIPAVGLLFRRSERSTGRIERLFLITPRLASIGEEAPAPRLDFGAMPGSPETQPLPAAPALPKGGARMGFNQGSAPNDPLPAPAATPAVAVREAPPPGFTPYEPAKD